MESRKHAVSTLLPSETFQHTTHQLNYQPSKPHMYGISQHYVRHCLDAIVRIEKYRNVYMYRKHLNKNIRFLFYLFLFFPIWCNLWYTNQLSVPCIKSKSGSCLLPRFYLSYSVMFSMISCQHTVVYCRGRFAIILLQKINLPACSQCLSECTQFGHGASTNDSCARAGVTPSCSGHSKWPKTRTGRICWHQHEALQVSDRWSREIKDSFL